MWLWLLAGAIQPPPPPGKLLTVSMVLTNYVVRWRIYLPFLSESHSDDLAYHPQRKLETPELSLPACRCCQPLEPRAAARPCSGLCTFPSSAPLEDTRGPSGA